VPLQRPYSARRGPRVAGRQHLTDQLDQLGQGGRPTSTIVLADPEHSPATDGEGSAHPAPCRPSQRRTAALALLGVLVIALGLAAWFRSEVDRLDLAAAKSNSALLDVGTTAQVTGQVRDAVERVFSYDFARLDDNERAASAVITGPFSGDYRQQFARVRELAPGQQAVVVATVPALAVKVLDGDRTVVVVFIDQQASRGSLAQPLFAAGRLSVIAQRVGGSWKIADVKPF
jgi:Mce-associated membrane protein